MPLPSRVASEAEIPSAKCALSVRAELVLAGTDPEPVWEPSRDALCFTAAPAASVFARMAARLSSSVVRTASFT